MAVRSGSTGLRRTSRGGYESPGRLIGWARLVLSCLLLGGSSLVALMPAPFGQVDALWALHRRIELFFRPSVWTGSWRSFSLLLWRALCTPSGMSPPALRPPFCAPASASPQCLVQFFIVRELFVGAAWSSVGLEIVLEVLCVEVWRQRDEEGGSSGGRWSVLQGPTEWAALRAWELAPSGIGGVCSSHGALLSCPTAEAVGFARIPVMVLDSGGGGGCPS